MERAGDANALPPRWLEALEDGPGGRRDLVGLADRLHEIAQARNP